MWYLCTVNAFMNFIYSKVLIVYTLKKEKRTMMGRWENALTGFSRSKGAALILILYLYFWAIFEPCDRWTRISLVILWMISLVYWCQASAKYLSTSLVYRSKNVKNEQARVFMVFSSQTSVKAWARCYYFGQSRARSSRFSRSRGFWCSRFSLG